jgi:hypothetical protein
MLLAAMSNPCKLCTLAAVTVFRERVRRTEVRVLEAAASEREEI